MTSKKKLGRRGPSDGKRMTWRYGLTAKELSRRGPLDDHRLAHRPTAKRWKLDDLYEVVKPFVIENKRVTVEGVADHFSAKKHLVHQCLHRMIREGTGLAEINGGGPHDTRRDGWAGPDTANVDASHWPNGWMATHYHMPGTIGPPVV